MIKTKGLLAVFFTAIFSALVNAQPLIITKDNAESKEPLLLYKHIQLIDAGSNNIKFEQLQQQLNSLPKTKLEHPNANVSFTSNYYWLVFSVSNTKQQTQFYYLEAARPITDQVTLYQKDSSGNVSLMQSGDAIPFSQRAFAHRKSVFKVQLPPNQTSQFFVNLKSDGEALDLGVKLSTSEVFLFETYTEQLVFGVFYGILFLAGITYLFFYLALRDKSFLFYGLYVSLIGLMQFAIDGLFYQYFGPSAGMYSLKGVILFATLGSLSFVLYTRSFLQINQTFGWLNTAYKTLIATLALLSLSVILPFSIPTFSYLVVNVFALLALLVTVVGIVIKHNKNEKVDAFFSIGIGFLALGITVFILNNFSLVPSSFITANGSKFGTGAEVIFLSLSMSNLIRKLRSEKEKAQAEALRKSEDMSELKSYFMKNMSHELRTPLNAIVGITNVMLSENLDARVKANFEIIKYSSYSLLSSVNDILDFNQIEKGEITLNQHEFAPKALFKQIELNARKQATDKGLIFTFEVDDLPAYLLGDDARLTQITNNVLSNAIKFTNSGYVSTKVQVVSRFDEQIELQLTISDSGVGIPKDKMDSIYEAFTQESINNKRKFGGLGLGLSIVKKLVELYKGSINIESKVAQGTTCTIVLPFVVTNKVLVDNAPAKPSIGEQKSASNKPLTILLVEDNSMNQMVMKLLIKKWENTTLTIANHGAECLEHLQQQEFDIVLMDLQMPVMDGYEAAIAIRAGEAGVGNISIPIIALTADITQGTEQRVKQIGMDRYLTKPVNQELLLETVRELTALKQEN